MLFFLKWHTTEHSVNYSVIIVSQFLYRTLEVAVSTDGTSQRRRGPQGNLPQQRVCKLMPSEASGTVLFRPSPNPM